MIARLATWHFCPDEVAGLNVFAEISGMLNDYPDLKHCEETGRLKVELNDYNIYKVGNTVIDTLPPHSFKVIVTLHRRENWGKRIQDALGGMLEIVQATEGVHITVIRHPNWRWEVPEKLEKHDRRFIYLPPVPRDRMLDYITHADLIVTDSGGLQEEAAHFGIPCIVVRESTERVALERLGAVEMVDPDAPDALKKAIKSHINRRRAYGCGDAAKKIAEILCNSCQSSGPKVPKLDKT